MFSHNKKSVSPICLQNLILPAVAIKLYCFKLHFEHQFCLNTRPFAFSIIDNNFDSGCHSNKIWNEAKFLCQVLTACKVSNKSDRRLLRYCTFIFSLSCSIASVTSYFIENEAENLQNGDAHLTQIPVFEMEYLENHLAHWGRWRLVFCIFHALSFELNFFFDRRFPLRYLLTGIFSRLTCFVSVKLTRLSNCARNKEILSTSAFVISFSFFTRRLSKKPRTTKSSNKHESKHEVVNLIHAVKTIQKQSKCSFLRPKLPIPVYTCLFKD